MTDPVADAGGNAGCVFIVEDDAAVRRSLALYLQLQGYATREYASAEDFLAAVPGERPACALVDINLPGMSGLDLQAHMRQQEADLPVLLMTARADRAMEQQAREQGASDFLEKPINARELLVAVRSALQGAPSPLPRR
jgi:FixJ family two-component response regulator